MVDWLAVTPLILPKVVYVLPVGAGADSVPAQTSTVDFLPWQVVVNLPNDMK